MEDKETTDTFTVNHAVKNSIGGVNFPNLYKQGEFDDCKLVTEEKTIACHRAVLSKHSYVLKAMFTNDMAESVSKAIKVVGFSGDTMDRIVQ